MKRRNFIALGGAAAWPLAAHAQQAQKMQRIGVLMHLAADDPEGQRRVAAFLQGLQEAGLAVGRNVSFRSRNVGRRGVLKEKPAEAGLDEAGLDTASGKSAASLATERKRRQCWINRSGPASEPTRRSNSCRGARKRVARRAAFSNCSHQA